MKEETWKAIPGFEGLYEVSDLGRVRSLDREVTGKSGSIRKLKSKILKTGISLDGRLLVQLSKEGKTTMHSVHKLVTLTFIGDRPNGYHICHIDGDSFNNRLSNLKYDTPKENFIDYYRQGLKTPNSKLSINAVVEIRKLYKIGGYSQTTLGKMFNVSHDIIHRVVTYKSYTHISDDGTIKESTTSIEYTG